VRVSQARLVETHGPGPWPPYPTALHNGEQVSTDTDTLKSLVHTNAYSTCVVAILCDRSVPCRLQVRPVSLPFLVVARALRLQRSRSPPFTPTSVVQLSPAGTHDRDGDDYSVHFLSLAPFHSSSLPPTLSGDASDW